MLRDERGSASVQLVMILPVMLSLVWAAVGAAMFFYGRTTAIAAAQAGATAGAAEHGTDAQCRAAAADMVARVGDALQQVTIICRRTPTTVTVTITGATLSLLPGWTPTLTQTATVPIERLTR